CGIGLSFILTWVVNRAFFHWTIGLEIPWKEIAVAPIWITFVALLASLIPAWRASRLPLAPALRAE
ncbi:MAG: FtsX-like permease family protein, partial [Verrucomicrobiota bacterium]